MTRAQSGANWSSDPSLSHPWMAALLRLAAMLVSHAVDPLRMLLTLLPRECHTDVERDRLPARESGPHNKEPDPAVPHSHSPEVLMVSSEQSSLRVYPELVEGHREYGRTARTTLSARVTN